MSGNKLLKLKMNGGGRGGKGGGALASERVIMSGGRRRLLLDKKDILSLGVHFTAVKKRRPPAHSCK